MTINLFLYINNILIKMTINLFFHINMTIIIIHINLFFHFNNTCIKLQSNLFYKKHQLTVIVSLRSHKKIKARLTIITKNTQIQVYTNENTVNHKRYIYFN
jgi:hypothetical protein